jgi:hypothetical protein
MKKLAQIDARQDLTAGQKQQGMNIASQSYMGMLNQGGANIDERMMQMPYGQEVQSYFDTQTAQYDALRQGSTLNKFAPEIVYGEKGGIYQASRNQGELELKPYTIPGTKTQAIKFQPTKFIKGEGEYLSAKGGELKPTGVKTGDAYKKDIEEKKLTLAQQESNRKALQFDNLVKKEKQNAKLLDQKIRSGQATVEDAYQTYADKTTVGVNVINKLLQHPGLPGAVGAKNWSSGFGLFKEPIGGTSEMDFTTQYNQINGQAFLQAFASIKGGGQITEIEGKKATEAITSMSRATSEKEFVRAANEFKSVLMKGLERAKKKYKQEKTPVESTYSDEEKEKRYQEWKAKQGK